MGCRGAGGRHCPLLFVLFEMQNPLSCRRSGEAYGTKSLTLPLKDGLITSDDIFVGCENLNQVHLVEGEVHETIAAFDFEEWRVDMNREIDSINQILPNACAGNHNAFGRHAGAGEKAQVIRTWIRSVLRKINHYKTEHQRMLGEAGSSLQHVLPHDIVMT